MILDTLLNNTSKDQIMFYLYVKTHSITGIKYLGYTSAKDPIKYPGSGVYWTAHLKKHGHSYTTEILKECQSTKEIQHWGQYYSNLWNVVANSDWANLIDETGDGGNLRNFWTETSKLKNKETRDSWISKITGKTYEEIHGVEKSNIIKQKQSSALKGKKLNLTDDERTARSQRIGKLNKSTVWSEERILKRSHTFKKRQHNIGTKNGMQTKPEAKRVIAEKNSKTHVLQNTLTDEQISVKNISQWAREQGLNPTTVLTKFCKSNPVNNWIRINVF